MKPPLVSVVMAVHDAEAYVGEAVQSALDQTHARTELVVVDDGSQDGSAEVVLGFGERIRLIRQPRAGIGAARNRGVEAARGEYLSFLDADDRLVPEALALELAAFRANPAPAAVFGHVREFLTPEVDPAERPAIRSPRPYTPGRLFPTAMLIRREAFDRVGPFSTALRVGVSLDWCARLAESGLPTALLPEVVMERRLHTSNNWSRERDFRLHYVRVLKAALDRRRGRAEGPGGTGPASVPGEG